jgi:ABC-type multidrug transport system permease subunit
VLAGVTPLEILVVQILMSFLVLFISVKKSFLHLIHSCKHIHLFPFQVTETVVLAFYLMNITIIGNGLTLILILFLTCAVGAFIGILLSTVSDDIKFISMFTLAFCQIISVLCGAVWPLEGQHWIVKCVSYILPITLPAISMRDVMIRGFGLLNKSVVMGMLVEVVWVVGTLSFAYVTIRKRKFSYL